MPVKRRLAKRRIDPEREFQIWAAILAAGFDFFGDLAELGVPINEHGRPDHKAAEAAWKAHGARILAECPPSVGVAWGLEEFGAPPAVRQR